MTFVIKKETAKSIGENRKFEKLYFRPFLSKKFLLKKKLYAKKKFCYIF